MASLMHANTNHRVVTLEESVTMGGHFYSVDNLERTMLAGLRENLWGEAVTNTTHPKSEAMLYRLALFLSKQLKMMEKGTYLFSDRERERLSGELEFDRC